MINAISLMNYYLIFSILHVTLKKKQTNKQTNKKTRNKQTKQKNKKQTNKQKTIKNI